MHTTSYGYKEKDDTDVSPHKRTDESSDDNNNNNNDDDEKSAFSKRTTAHHLYRHHIHSLVSSPGHVFFEFIMAFMVRLWHSGVPQFLTQSEFILAQQINWTLKGQFHIGTTPPLATLLYSIVARWTGYQGSESILYAGQTMHEFPLATLRHVTILTSSLVIPVIYVFVRMLGCAHTTALFTSGLFIFGNIRRRCLTSILLGSALCTKWQAGSLVAFFLAVTAYDFWIKICDPTVVLKKMPKWVAGQLLTLLVLPFSVYLVLFQWHFHKVPHAGEHDMFLSSPLRYSLIGNSFEPVQQYIAYGSHVVLKHVSSNNGYLHSDDKVFTAGSNQNQVTVYPYEDINNIWVIQKVDKTTYSKTDAPDYLYNNNAFKLEHYASMRKLHSHDQSAPIHTGEGFYEVTSYGNPTVTHDGNDAWWIRVVTDDEGYDTSNHDPINALTTRFRVLHSKGCYLSSHYNTLPLATDGAQQEVSCMNSAKTSVASWVFEYAHHPNLKNISPMVQYGPLTFKKKLEQVHKLMRNYKKAVYDRLSSLPADVLDSTATMMDSDEEPQPFTWMRHIHAYIIWDDLTGRSVYVVLQPMLRHVTLLCLGVLPLVAVFSALATQLNWTRSALWCQQFWSSRHIQTTTIMMGGALTSTIGLLVATPHTVTLSDLLPTLLFGTIAFTNLMEWCTLAPDFKRRRPLTGEHPPAGVFFATSSPAEFSSSYFLTAHTRQHLHRWLILILMSLHVLSFLRWSHAVDGAHAWTSVQCKVFAIDNVDCEKYPLTPPLQPKRFPTDDDTSLSVVDPHLLEEVPQEDHDNRMESRHIMMPGTPLRFEYERGQEIRAEMEIAKVRQEAFTKAIDEITVPAHRFVRAIMTPGPSLDDVLELREQMHLYTLEKEGLPALSDDQDGIEIHQDEDQHHLAARKKKKRQAKKVKKNKKGKKIKADKVAPAAPGAAAAAEATAKEEVTPYAPVDDFIAKVEE
ncbi:hypothetical protein BCR42DRAFT_495571 [Absidia repens]|uniref:dolichyl-phosphate-mannose--protein mannosyltransferase n=1 Tax=Absidia repens TaxID=90262 RepID=A0A1X2I2Q0_9FUNG|nr:hypothetical protein BCR42DRAFT_495571 [Absidia repens]